MTTRNTPPAAMTTKTPRPLAVIENEMGVLNSLLLNPARLTDARHSCLSQRRKLVQAELAAAKAATQAEAMP